MTNTVSVYPTDEHNRTLLSNAHPADWVNPDPAPRYNLVVIGAGTAGLVAAAGAAGLGARVALVESNLMGGDCLNVGCVPSKCIIRSSRAAADVMDAGRFGIKTPQEVEADFAQVMARMRKLRAKISYNDSVRRFKELGIDVFLGEGKFAGPDTVKVEDWKLRFKKAVIATGARAAAPPVEGLAEAGYITNETVFSLTEKPGRLAVLGGGPLGCELAQAFSRLGSRVTVIERETQFLTREDREAAEILAESFAEDGIYVKLNTTVKKVKINGNDKILHVETNGEESSIAVDEILVAAGRAPNVQNLNLGAAGVDYNSRTGITVNDRLRTTNRRIYSAGDVCLKYRFTHTADATARIVIQNALFFGRKKVSNLTVPWCTYTDPEIAHVGMYEREAREKGIAVNSVKISMEDVDRAVADGEERGFVKIHLKEGADKILGATIVARHAGEMISELTAAMAGKVGLGAISNVIHPYPTQAEAIRKAADMYNRDRLTPNIRKWFKRYLSWIR